MNELTNDLQFMNEIINVLPNNIPGHYFIRRWTYVLSYQSLINNINETLDELRNLKRLCAPLIALANPLDSDVASLRANLNRFHELTIRLYRLLTQYGGNQDKVQIIENRILQYHQRSGLLLSNTVLQHQLDATTAQLQNITNNLGQQYANGAAQAAPQSSHRFFSNPPTPSRAWPQAADVEMAVPLQSASAVAQSALSAAQPAFAAGQPAPSSTPIAHSPALRVSLKSADDKASVNVSGKNHKRGSDSDDSPSKKQRPQRG